MTSTPDEAYADSLHKLYIAVALRHMQSAGFRMSCNAEVTRALARVKEIAECLCQTNTKRT